MPDIPADAITAACQAIPLLHVHVTKADVIRALEAAAPALRAQGAAAERERIRKLANPGTLRLFAAQLAFDDKPDESSNLYALADLLDGGGDD